MDIPQTEKILETRMFFPVVVEVAVAEEGAQTLFEVVTAAVDRNGSPAPPFPDGESWYLRGAFGPRVETLEYLLL